MIPLVLALAALLSSACSTSVEVPDGVFACATDAECPEGFSCDAAGRCRAPRDAGLADGSTGG